MLEAQADQSEYVSEKAMLRDGSLVNVNDARLTIRSVCKMTDRSDPFACIDRLFEIRANIDDLQGYVDVATEGMDETYISYKKMSINEALRSRIFDVDQPDMHWVVPPKTAVAVFRNMVCITQEEGGEVWLQEPFNNRTDLADTWQKLHPTK